MAATIRIGPYEAECHEGEWTCEDKGTADLLNAFSANQAAGPSVPDQDAHLARLAVEQLGARLVRVDPPPPTEPGRVY